MRLLYFQIVTSLSVLLTLLINLDAFAASKVMESEIAGITDYLKNINTTIEASLDTDLDSWKSSDKDVSSSYSLTIDYAINKKASVGTVASFSKDLTGERKGKLDDGVIYGNYSFGNLTEDISFKLFTTLLVPLSDHSRNESYFMSGMKLTPSIRIKFDKIKMKSVTLIISPSVTKNFHKHKVSSLGDSNTSHALNGGLGLLYVPTSFLSLGQSFSISQKYTYQNKSVDPSYSNSIYTTYSYKKMSFTFGVSNSGDLYKENGHDLNIRLFDPETMSLFASFAYTF